MAELKLFSSKCTGYFQRLCRAFVGNTQSKCAGRDQDRLVADGQGLLTGYDRTLLTLQGKSDSRYLQGLLCRILC